ncbi:MAG: TIGR01777 family oxidoreductase [Pseudomonadota bacterium]
MTDPVLWTLIAVQIAMGAFDTLVHHEGTERLAWRPSQQTELRLHGVRNLFYALIFLAFGWFQPQGVFTWILATILAVEVLITLWDFVEEDMTRALPATERVNHTLLALNYGAILALAGPVLWDWALLPGAMIPVSYGWWSVMATGAAIGVAIFGVRDLFAAARSTRLGGGDPAALVADLPPNQRVLITGGTGFIGTRLVTALVAGGHDVTVLTRDPDGAELPHPVRLIDSLDLIQDEEVFDLVVNLAGEGIATGLWTVRKRAQIIESRMQATQELAALIDRLETKPSCMITGSAIGWYGLTGDEPLAEGAASSPCFLHDVCAAWETAAEPIEASGVRVVKLRLGLVLGIEGGLLAKLLMPFEFGAGFVLGRGRQWMSWIALDDVIRTIAFAAVTPGLDGPINAVAPGAVRNVDFSRTLAATLRRPLLLRIPSWALSGLLGSLGRETMLSGQRVLPEKFAAHGFVFMHEELAPLLSKITGDKRRQKAGAVSMDEQSGRAEMALPG